MSLICPKCNTANLDEAKFCKNCGVNIANALIKEKNYRDWETDRKSVV